MPTCDTCGQACQRPSSLRRHKKSQHGNEQHECSVCHKHFARRDNLLKHQKTQHEAHDVNPPWSPLQAVSSDTDMQDAEATWSPTLVTESHPSMTLDHNLGFDTSAAPEQTFSFDELNAIRVEPALDSPPGPVFDNPAEEISETWTNIEDGVPQCPTSVLNAAEALRHAFPKATIDATMYLCLVHRPTNVPILRPPQLVESAQFTLQYIPAIRCLDCVSNNIFPVKPNLGAALVEDHLHSTQHMQSIRLRYIARTRTAQAAVNTISRGRGATKALDDLANQRLSLQSFSSWHYQVARQSLLILAVKIDDAHGLRHLLEEGLDVVELDPYGRTALHWACYRHKSTMIEILISHGAKLNILDRCFDTPLALILRGHNVTAAIHLINAEARIRGQERPALADTPLMLACRYDQLEVVQEMIRLGADVNEAKVTSPLVEALRWASFKVVQVLLQAGATPHAVDWHEQLLLRNKRDRLSLRYDTRYQDAQGKITLFKAYGLDMDSAAEPAKTPGPELTIPSEQPWLRRM